MTHLLGSLHQAVSFQRTAISFVSIVSLTLALAATRAVGQDSITTELGHLLQHDTTGRAGILFGQLTRLTEKPKIWCQGAIDRENDLRLGCPTSKPALAFLTLKENLNLDASIDSWFPEKDGFTQSQRITLKELLLNSSGIRDFVPLIPMHPDSAVSVPSSIDRAYRHQALLFTPGTNFTYSNTNFNILGRILEIKTTKTLSVLFQKYFGSFAPSVRLDDGRGSYPKGYVKPWPYHWMSPGFAGGFIGTAADALRLFAYIASQPEFAVMTRWYKTDGSYSTGKGDHLLGLGVFGTSDFAGLGEASIYEGDMGPCQMILARVQSSTFCIYSSHNMGIPELRGLFEKLVRMSFQSLDNW